MKSAEEAYETLIAPIEKRMMRAVARIVRDPDDMADAFQNALALVWRDIPRIQRHPNPHAYILRLCANASYDLLRKRARLRRREVSVQEDFLADMPGAGLPEAIQREGIRAIMDAILQLSPNQAEAFYMREIEGFSFEEIAQAIGCGESTVRVHLSNAKARLRVLLTEEK
jgi:RNA polymerase sigma-70 factor (ECF subfamily)